MWGDGVAGRREGRGRRNPYGRESADPGSGIRFHSPGDAQTQEHVDAVGAHHVADRRVGGLVLRVHVAGVGQYEHQATAHKQGIPCASAVSCDTGCPLPPPHCVERQVTLRPTDRRVNPHPAIRSAATRAPPPRPPTFAPTWMAAMREANVSGSDVPIATIDMPFISSDSPTADRESNGARERGSGQGEGARERGSGQGQGN